MNEHVELNGFVSFYLHCYNYCLSYDITFKSHISVEERKKKVKKNGNNNKLSWSHIFEVKKMLKVQRRRISYRNKFHCFLFFVLLASFVFPFYSNFQRFTTWNLLISLYGLLRVLIIVMWHSILFIIRLSLHVQLLSFILSNTRSLDMKNFPLFFKYS